MQQIKGCYIQTRKSTHSQGDEDEIESPMKPIKGNQQYKLSIEFQDDQEFDLSNRQFYSSQDTAQHSSFKDTFEPDKPSPMMSQTSQDLQSKKQINIRQVTTSHCIPEIPQVMLAFRRKRIQITGNSQSVSQSELAQKHKKTKYQSQSWSVLTETHQNDEEYSIWEDDEDQYGPIHFTTLEFLTKLEQFLTLYKMRSGTYKQQRDNLLNERVIAIAINLTRIDKKLFKKYFPTKKVTFHNDIDYSIQRMVRFKCRQQTQLIQPCLQIE